MAEDSHEPSGATLGYLAPICVAVFFIFVCFRYRIIFGTRQRFRAGNRQLDPEGWPLGFPHTVLTAADLDARFPSIKYSVWSEAHRRHSCSGSKEKEIEVDPSTSQAPRSPSSTRSLDATEQEAVHDNEGKCSDNDAASSHCDAHMECAICMEDFDDEDSVRTLTCDHVFHVACLDPWFTKRQSRCPLCKTYYPPDPAFPSAPVRPAAALLRNQIFPRVL
ncbi:hypothetical protein BDV18DRAFT_28792 [Aspergillus unguis]